jgi:hypothetical protein
MTEEIFDMENPLSLEETIKLIETWNRKPVYGKFECDIKDIKEYLEFRFQVVRYSHFISNGGSRCPMDRWVLIDNGRIFNFKACTRHKNFLLSEYKS